eukprot:1418982-Rhodomonas_salina.1
MEKHLGEECPCRMVCCHYRGWNWERGCNVIMIFMDKEAHECECEWRFVKCTASEDCKWSGLFFNLKGHLKEDCDYIEVECNLCKEG